MVHLLIRHGARTPWYHVHGNNSGLDLGCNFSKWYSENGDDEKFKLFPKIVDNVRKQERKILPFDKETLYPNMNKCSAGRLTGFGALQHLKLGQFISSRYINNEHLFDQASSLTSQMHIRYTKATRAVHSAMAFLYGFLPEFHLSDLTITKSVNKFMCASGEIPCTCKITTAYYKKRYQFSRVRESYVINYIRLRKKLQSTVYSKNETDITMKQLFGVLTIYFCHGKTVPCFSNLSRVCVFTYSDVNQLQDYYISRKMSMVTDDPERNALKWAFLILYPVMTEMADRMRDYVDGKSKETFIMYSGHENMLQAIRIVLGVFDGRKCPFATRIAFELYENETKTYYLRILYNGDDITSNVSFCKKHSIGTLCKLENFKDFLDSSLHNLFHTSDYVTACERTLDLQE